MNFIHGTVTVAAAGTAVRVTTATTPVKWVRFKADPDNTTDAYVGLSVVDSTTGFPLSATGVDEMENLVLDPGKYDGVLDLKDFWCDAVTNGEKVRYAAIVARGS